ncbi:metallophosphoesterase [Candidatus Woesearchaeota archaeon]|nr:metallophosphoesterase [Candidatus Woesearchaeota archaeon]
MKILPHIEIVDLALYFDSTLVIADVHIGYEEALNKQGVLVPRLQFKEMTAKMNNIFETLKNKKIERIIVNGDLKHEFGAISEQEWRNTLKFIDLLAKHCNELILIKGNHDNILGPIAKKRNVKVLDYCIVEPSMDKPNDKKNPIIKKTIKRPRKTLIIHGNKIPGKEVLEQADSIIIGHEHPAVSIREGPRVEQFKCLLKGRYKGRNLIVQPSFNTIVEGTDLLRDKILSPFLKQNIGNFDVYVVEGRVYHFGKLKGLRKS